MANNNNNKKLRVIPLGGLEEVGKNITAFEYGNDIIVVDCGVAFPSEDMLGIDLVLPDFTYLVRNKDKVRAVVLTHGHEDHIGAVPYLLKNFDVPIYGTRLTLALLNNKLKEHNIKATLNTVEAGDTIKLGVFGVEFIRVNHSIADSCALAIDTPAGMVVHTGDFKIDHTPVDGSKFDLQRFGELGKKGVKLLLCESTNAESPGYTMSEKSVGDVLSKIFQDTDKQRLMIATFSSNIHRISQIINFAERANRKVIIMGRSMVNAVKTSRELGYIKCSDEIFIDISQVKDYPDEKIVIITTGSQGEPMAALSRMAASEHRQIDIKPGDKIIISASPIPGNEKLVSRVINQLMKKGAEVIYEKIMDIHVSGHAKQEEIKMIHSLLNPQYIVPIHGEYKHLKSHRDLAISCGYDKENVFIMSNGEVLEINQNGAKVNGIVPSGRTLVDGLGIGDVGNIVLRDRKLLSEDGLIIVVVGIDRECGIIVTGPDIISRGFVYVRESENLMEEAKEVVKTELFACSEKELKDWNYVKGIIRDSLKEYVWQTTKRSPMILPVIMEV